MERLKNNKVTLNGTITEVAVEERVAATSGKEYVSGTVSVTYTDADGQLNTVKPRVLCFKLTKDGNVNKQYDKMKNLGGFLGHRVNIAGELREESMVSPTTGELVKFNSIAVRFINEARSQDVDGCTFEFGGFVTKSITERNDKEGNLFGYRIEVAQADYSNTNMQVIRFDVDMNDLAIIKAIESHYVPGATVSFSGAISWVETMETITEEVAFGAPITKNVNYTNKYYFIKGGKEPSAPESDEAYPQNEIAQLIAAYKAKDLATVERAKGDSSTPVAAKSVSRSGSLI